MGPAGLMALVVGAHRVQLWQVAEQAHGSGDEGDDDGEPNCVADWHLAFPHGAKVEGLWWGPGPRAVTVAYGSDHVLTLAWKAQELPSSAVCTHTDTTAHDVDQGSSPRGHTGVVACMAPEHGSSPGYVIRGGSGCVWAPAWRCSMAAAAARLRVTCVCIVECGGSAQRVSSALRLDPALYGILFGVDTQAAAAAAAAAVPSSRLLWSDARGTLWHAPVPSKPGVRQAMPVRIDVESGVAYDVEGGGMGAGNGATHMLAARLRRNHKEARHRRRPPPPLAALYGASGSGRGGTDAMMVASNGVASAADTLVMVAGASMLVRLITLSDDASTTVGQVYDVPLHGDMAGSDGEVTHVNMLSKANEVVFCCRGVVYTMCLNEPCSGSTLPSAVRASHLPDLLCPSALPLAPGVAAIGVSPMNGDERDVLTLVSEDGCILALDVPLLPHEEQQLRTCLAPGWADVVIGAASSVGDRLAAVAKVARQEAHVLEQHRQLDAQLTDINAALHLVSHMDDVHMCVEAHVEPGINFGCATSLRVCIRNDTNVSMSRNWTLLLRVGHVDADSASKWVYDCFALPLSQAGIAAQGGRQWFSVPLRIGEAPSTPVDAYLLYRAPLDVETPTASTAGSDQRDHQQTQVTDCCVFVGARTLDWLDVCLVEPCDASAAAGMEPPSPVLVLPQLWNAWRKQYNASDDDGGVATRTLLPSLLGVYHQSHDSVPLSLTTMGCDRLLVTTADEGALDASLSPRRPSQAVLHLVVSSEQRQAKVMIHCGPGVRALVRHALVSRMHALTGVMGAQGKEGMSFSPPSSVRAMEEVPVTTRTTATAQAERCKRMVEDGSETNVDDLWSRLTALREQSEGDLASGAKTLLAWRTQLRSLLGEGVQLYERLWSPNGQ